MVKHGVSDPVGIKICHSILIASYQFPTLFEQNIMLLHMEVSNMECPVEKEFCTFHFW